MFLLLTIVIVARGVQKGIEKASKVMMPALFICFLILIIRSLTLSGVGDGIAFFLYPHFSDLDSKPIMVFFFIFILLFLFATLTSAFSLLELVVAALIKEDKSKRRKISGITGMIIFILGVPSALSYGLLSDFKIFGSTPFDLADFLASNIFLPLGALAISIFVIVKIPRKTLLQEFSAGTSYGKRLFAAWLLLIRYVAPVAIIIVFLDVIGVWGWIGF